jgi:hypothetical protein
VTGILSAPKYAEKEEHRSEGTGNEGCGSQILYYRAKMLSNYAFKQ